MDKHIFLFGEIGGWGISEADVLRDIAEAKEQKAELLIVQISSFGGYVYSGRAIYNALKASGIYVRVEIIGQAFSIASYVAMAGDEILIAPKGEIMIHPAWRAIEGNADEMRKAADELETMSKEIFNTYVERGAKEDVIRAYFDEEKILTADEAIEAGLATGLLEPMKAVAKFDSKKDIINSNTKTMEEKNLITRIWEKLNKVLPAKNASVETGNGTLYFDGEELAEGIAVFSDEAMTEPAADGDYVVGATTYTVSGGSVSAVVTDEEEEPSEELAQLQARVAELESANAALLAEKDAAVAEASNVKAEVAEIESMLVQEKIQVKNNKVAAPKLTAASRMAEINNKNKSK